MVGLTLTLGSGRIVLGCLPNYEIDDGELQQSGGGNPSTQSDGTLTGTSNSGGGSGGSVIAHTASTGTANSGGSGGSVVPKSTSPIAANSGGSGGSVIPSSTSPIAANSGGSGGSVIPSSTSTTHAGGPSSSLGGTASLGGTSSKAPISGGTLAAGGSIAGGGTTTTRAPISGGTAAMGGTTTSTAPTSGFAMGGSASGGVTSSATAGTVAAGGSSTISIGPDSFVGNWLTVSGLGAVGGGGEPDAATCFQTNGAKFLSSGFLVTQGTDSDLLASNSYCSVRLSVSGAIATAISGQTCSTTFGGAGETITIEKLVITLGADKASAGVEAEVTNASHVNTTKVACFFSWISTKLNKTAMP